MNTYEIKWKPETTLGISMKTEIINANSMEEAVKMVEAKAKSMGAKNIDWYGKRQIG